MKVVLGCFAFLCIVVLAGAFLCLNWLQSIKPEELSAPYIPSVSSGGPDKHFDEKEQGDHYVVKYDFTDFQDKSHTIACNILKSDYSRERKEFGYTQREIDAAIDGQLQKWLNGELQKRKIASYFRIKVSDGGSYKWEYNIPGGLPAAENDRATQQVEAMKTLIKTEYDRKFDEIEDAVFRQRGLLVHDKLIQIDYGSLVLRSQQPLLDCFEALLQSGHGFSEKDYVGMYLSFIQQIRYQVPPDNEDGKDILGLWVPTEVMLHNHGDCDSKSVTLSTFLRSFGLPVMVILIPRHALIAVEMRPGPDQQFVRVGNRYFVLCEAAGPARLPPGDEGARRLQGHFEFTLIEPDQKGIAAILQKNTF